MFQFTYDFLTNTSAMIKTIPKPHTVNINDVFAAQHLFQGYKIRWY